MLIKSTDGQIFDVDGDAVVNRDALVAIQATCQAALDEATGALAAYDQLNNPEPAPEAVQPAEAPVEVPVAEAAPVAEQPQPEAPAEAPVTPAEPQPQDVPVQI